MEIASAEVGANIVEHTGLGQPLRIRMNAALVNDQLHVAFTDNGPPVIGAAVAIEFLRTGSIRL